MEEAEGRDRKDRNVKALKETSTHPLLGSSIEAIDDSKGKACFLTAQS